MTPIDTNKVQLDAVAQADRKIAERMQWPLWRHAAFGLVEGLLVLGPSLPIPTGIAVIVVALGALGWIVHDDKQRYGMFVSGWQEGTKTITVTIAVVVVSLMIVSISRTGEPAPDPIAVGAALGAFFAATIGSLLWQKAYQRHLRRGTTR